MSYYYAVGPVAYSADPEDPSVYFYHPPEGVVGWIDTRPNTPDTLTPAFFAFHEYPNHLKDTHTILGDGNRLEEYYPTALERSAWETMYGVKVDDSWTLLDCLRDLLFIQADPDGLVLCKPCTPTHLGNLEIHLGGHSRILREKFTGKGHISWPLLQKMQQNTMTRLIKNQSDLAKQIRSLSPNDELGKQITKQLKNRKDGASFSDVKEEMAKKIEDVPSKVLTDICRLYKCDPIDVLPKNVQIERMKPTTTFQDDFERADAALESSGNATWGGEGQGWSWARMSAIVINIVSGNARTATSSANGWYRIDSAYSTHNMKASGSLSISGTGRSGPAVRVANSGVNGYFADRSSTSGRLRKIVNGIDTSLTTTTVTSDNPITILCQIDGSTLSGTFNGGSGISITDTTFEGVLYAGFFHRRGSSGDSLFHQFTSEDIPAPPPPPATNRIPAPLAILNIR